MICHGYKVWGPWIVGWHLNFRLGSKTVPVNLSHNPDEFSDIGSVFLELRDEGGLEKILGLIANVANEMSKYIFGKGLRITPRGVQNTATVLHVTLSAAQAYLLREGAALCKAVS